MSVVDMPTERRINVSESADKIRLDAKIVRGTDTRDQETIKVTIKGDDPDDTVDRLEATLERLADTADFVRAIDPERDDHGGAGDD